MVKKFFICDQSALRRGGHYLEYTHCVAEATQALGLATYILCNKRLQQADWGQSSLIRLPVYTKTWAETEEARLHHPDQASVVIETLGALSSSGASPNDHVLLHTVSPLELRSWLQYLVDLPLYRLLELPRIHLILRFDPERLEADTSHEWRSLLNRVHDRADILCSYVHFCADTDPLAHRYSALLGFTIGVAPIPFPRTSRFRYAHKMQRWYRPRSQSRSYILVMPGEGIFAFSEDGAYIVRITRKPRKFASCFKPIQMYQGVKAIHFTI